MSDREPQHPNDELDDPESTTVVLEALRPSLADSAVWSEPPASLEASVVAAIAAERDRQGSGTVDLEAHRQRRLPSRWLAVAAAAVVALAVGAGVLLTRDDGGQPGGEQLAIAGTDLAPDASATVVVNDTGAGVAIRLDLQGLEPAPRGQYYQGWLRNAAGDLVGIGSFHMRDGDAVVTLWAGVEVEDYPTLTVTLQTEGQGTDSSGEVVLRGSLVDTTPAD